MLCIAGNPAPVPAAEPRTALFAMLEFVLYPPPEIARTPPPPRSRNGNSNGHHPATPAAPPRKSPPRRRLRTPALLSIFALWLAIFFASLWTPPLLDDADATHAQAAQSMLQTGDWVTLHVNGVRYLEKAPLPYWMAAISLGVFGRSSFAIHLPLALTVLALALLGFVWSRRAFGQRAALYTAIFLLTSAGVFLFTRIFIPDALLSLLLALSLYCLLRALEPTTSAGAPRLDSETWVRRTPSIYAYLMWTALALAVLTKGLVALVFFFGSAAIYLSITGEARHWSRLRPFSGALLFLAIAAPWHVLAGLRNTGGMNGHGFFWFYFINEHVLRFLGRRVPMDYNKLPGYLYWTLHIAWLFPWSLFLPLAFVAAWRCRAKYALTHLRSAAMNFASRTVLLAAIYSALVLIFFSLSTNQEYYTFPAYLPLLMLLAASLARAERTLNPGPWALDPTLDRLILAAYIAFTLLGLAIALALGYGLWTSRHLPFVPDIGDVLAHRNVGDYTLSMSHFFDLTGPSFAALRLPAALAAIAFAIGPIVALILHNRRRSQAAILTVAITNATFLLAAHLAFTRFAPILSSQNFAARILTLEQQHEIAPDTQVLLFGDQSFGSSIPFYLNRRVFLVDGRSTSMLFGSTFPDMPPVFLTTQQLLAEWGHGPRKILFVPAERRADADRLLGPQIILAETSGKLLLTDRPLPPSSQLDSSKLEAQQNPASNK
jgi:4-amino-4-deoxy-L-arabinose transferase-like glycosyltransferase